MARTERGVGGGGERGREATILRLEWPARYPPRLANGEILWEFFPKAELKSAFPEPTPPCLSLPPHSAQSRRTDGEKSRLFTSEAASQTPRRGGPQTVRGPTWRRCAPFSRPRLLLPSRLFGGSSRQPKFHLSSLSHPLHAPLEARREATTSRQCPLSGGHPGGPPAACGRSPPPSAPAAPRAGSPRLSPPARNTRAPASPRGGFSSEREPAARRRRPGPSADPSGDPPRLLASSPRPVFARGCPPRPPQRPAAGPGVSAASHPWPRSQATGGACRGTSACRRRDVAAARRRGAGACAARRLRPPA